MIKYNFTAVIKQWLDRDPEDRDPVQGAITLLQIDGNRVRFDNIMRNPQRYIKFLETELRRYYDQILNTPSEEEKQKIRSDARKLLAEQTSLKSDNPASIFRAGKRPDHDSLPENIQQIYVNNLDIRRRMQQYHLQIRMLLKSKRDCAPEDIRDLCELLKKEDIAYHRNWNTYDTFGNAPNDLLDKGNDE